MNQTSHELADVETMHFVFSFDFSVGILCLKWLCHTSETFNVLGLRMVACVHLRSATRARMADFFTHFIVECQHEREIDCDGLDDFEVPSLAPRSSPLKETHICIDCKANAKRQIMSPR